MGAKEGAYQENDSGFKEPYEMIKTPRRSKRKGLSRPDPLLDKWKGYDLLEEASRDSMKLAIEARFVGDAVFPYIQQPIPGREDIITHGQNYFAIEHPNQVIKKDMESYFLNDHSRYSDHLFGHAYSLGGFLSSIAHQIFLKGKSFHGIGWGEVDIQGRKYILPVEFYYLETSTMRTHQHANKIFSYSQAYSWWTYITQKRFADYEGNTKPRVAKFDQTEVFYCQYPFGKTSPAQRSLRYLRDTGKFWRYSINQGQAGLEPNNFYLPIETVRYSNFTVEKRKYDLARSKIRTIFYYLLDSNGPKITQYYDIYTVVRYKKTLNKIRDYLVDVFNQQIMETIRVKNGFDVTPLTTYSGFSKSEDLDKSLEEFTEGKITIDDFIKDVARHS